MKYSKTFLLKDGREAIIRNGVADDGPAVYDNIIETHLETDYMLSYPDECTFNGEKEAKLLEKKTASDNEVELVVFVDGKVAGSAGISSIGDKYKIKHRADFGISLLKEYWGLGLGSALMEACIECARKAGYLQIELEAVAENERALALYKKMGFVEFGRNPRGFNSRASGYQELVYMRLEL